MDTALQQQVQKRFAELPPDVQRAITSTDLQKKIQALGKKYALHIDQTGNLEDEAMLVMLGFSDPGELAINLGKALSVETDKAVAIATDMANELFMPVRESMREFMESRAAEQTAALVSEVLPQTPSAAIPTPTTPEIKTPQTPDLHAADMMLSGKTVATAAPVAPAQKAGPPASTIKPGPYKLDPYHEPIE